MVEKVARAINPFPFQMLDLGTSGDRGAYMRRLADEALGHARAALEAIDAAGCEIRPKPAPPMTCPKCGIERGIFPACAQDGCPTLMPGRLGEPE